MPEAVMRRAAAVLLVAGLTAVAACAGGTDDGGPAAGPPPAAPPATLTAATSAAPPPSPTAADPDPARCFLGSHDVVSITSREGVATPFGSARPAGNGGSLVLDLRADQAWRLSSDGSRPVTFEVGQYTVDAVIRGELSGTYRRAGTSFAFEQDDADGTVTLTTPVGTKEYDMDTVGPALAPGGAATITCGADAVQFTSESVTMTLRRR
jgi:hypothetical protein